MMASLTVLLAELVLVLVLTHRFTRFREPLKYRTLLERITDTPCLTRGEGEETPFFGDFRWKDRRRLRDMLAPVELGVFQFQWMFSSLQYTFDTSQCTQNQKTSSNFNNIARHGNLLLYKQRALHAGVCWTICLQCLGQMLLPGRFFLSLRF